MTMSIVGGGPPPALSLAEATCVVLWQFPVEDAGHRAGSVAYEEKTSPRDGRARLPAESDRYNVLSHRRYG